MIRSPREYRSPLDMLANIPPSAAAPPVLTGPGGRLTPTPGGAIEVAAHDGATAVFEPLIAVLSSATDPNLEMRWGQFPEPAMKLSDTGSIYNVLTWGRKGAAPGASSSLS